MKFIATIIVTLALYSSTTMAQWSPGEPFSDTRDGQTYRTVVIGSQVWMAENMNIGTYISSSRFGSLMRDNSTIERYCWENTVANCDGDGGVMKRGGLYEWEEAVQYWSGQPTHPVRGICPEGWHMPSNNEWRILTLYLGNTAAYIAMLEGGSSGFDAKLTGYREESNGRFRPARGSDELRTYFWAADQQNDNWAHMLEVGPGSIATYPYAKALGVCVRCIRDAGATDVEDSALPVDELSILEAIPRGGRSILAHFTTSGGLLNLVVSDLLGRVVHRSTLLTRPGENFHVIELSRAAAGSYILSMQVRTAVDMRVLRIL